MTKTRYFSSLTFLALTLLCASSARAGVTNRAFVSSTGSDTSTTSEINFERSTIAVNGSAFSVGAGGNTNGPGIDRFSNCSITNNWSLGQVAVGGQALSRNNNTIEGKGASNTLPFYNNR